MAPEDESTNARAFGTYLRLLRGTTPRTRAARDMQLSAAQLKRWEEGEEVPSTADIFRLAQGYGVPMEHFLDRLLPDFRPTPAITLARTALDHRTQVVQMVRLRLETAPPSKVTTRSLMKQTGWSFRRLFRDFRDKEDIIIQVVRVPLQDYRQDVATALTRKGKRQRIDMVAAAWAKLAQELPGTVFTHIEDYPVPAQEQKADYDARAARAVMEVAGSSRLTRRFGRVALAAWREAACWAVEEQLTPDDRRQAILDVNSQLKSGRLS